MVDENGEDQRSRRFLPLYRMKFIVQTFDVEQRGKEPRYTS
jgi:hypothetical protein